MRQYKFTSKHQHTGLPVVGHQQKDRQHKRRGPTSEPRQQPIKQYYNVQNTQICGDAKSQKDEAKTAREARLLSVVSKQRNTKTNSQPLDHTRTLTNTETGQQKPLWANPVPAAYQDCSENGACGSPTQPANIGTFRSQYSDVQ